MNTRGKFSCVTPEARAEIAKDYAAAPAEKLADIAERHRTSAATVAQIARAAGLPRRKRSPFTAGRPRCVP